MSDASWPDPERPGVPLNPERDVWHWIDDGRGPECAEFLPIAGTWVKVGTEVEYGLNYAARWRYLGPVLTPAEVAAAVAEARRAALEEVARVWKQMVSNSPHWEWSEKHAAALRALAKEPTMSARIGSGPPAGLPNKPSRKEPGNE